MTIETIADTFGGLARQPVWVGWRYKEVKGRVTKVPFRLGSPAIAASSTKPSTWDFLDRFRPDTFSDGGLGVALGPHLQGIDLDACLGDEGKLEDWAREFVDSTDSYTEVSPSGHGVKIFVRGVTGESVTVKFGDEVTFADGKRKGREVAL
ncbi:MAG: hypothetical protein AB7V13_30665, partial [Pseudorhodoplanes sp.]